MCLTIICNHLQDTVEGEAETAPESPAPDDDYCFPFADCDFVASSLNLAASTPATVKTVLDHLELNCPTVANPQFLDLGCGDGRLVFAAAQRGLFSVGIDLDPSNITMCREMAKENGLSDKCQFHLTDMFTYDLSQFNLITCYLYEKTLGLVSKRLMERLREGNCVLATILYKPPKWIPIFVDDVYKVYLFDGTTQFEQ